MAWFWSINDERLKGNDAWRQEWERLAHQTITAEVVPFTVAGWVGELLAETPEWNALVAIVNRHNLVARARDTQIAVNSHRWNFANRTAELQPRTPEEEELTMAAGSLIAQADIYLHAANYVTAYNVTNREELAQLLHDLYNRNADVLAEAMKRAGVDPTGKVGRSASPEAALRHFLVEIPKSLLALANWLVSQLGLAPLPSDVEQAEWAKAKGAMQLPADLGMMAVVNMLAGRITPIGTPDRDGWESYPTKSSRGRGKKVRAFKAKAAPNADMAVMLAENTDGLDEQGLLVKLLSSDVVKPVLEKISRERNELKAKTFLAALSYGLISGTPESFHVSLKQLMKALGYELRVKTSSDMYWKHAAHVIRYLAVDLPNQVVHIHAELPGAKKPLVIEEYLMHRPRAIGEQLTLPGEGFQRAVLEAVKNGDEKMMAAFLREVAPEGFRLGFPEDILTALGAAESRAIEVVGDKFLSLQGPAFWLGYQVLFLRRWSKGETPEPKRCTTLHDTLKEAGYLERETTKDGKVRVKEAIRDWFAALHKVADIGLLKEPGVTLYRQTPAGSWADVTLEIQRMLDAGGGRITLEDTEALRVSYLLPDERLAERATATKRSQAFKAAGMKRLAARNAATPS